MVPLLLNEEPSSVEKGFIVVSIDPLAADEPLSPELVLVLPPELRAKALARLDPPVWPKLRPPVRALPLPADDSLTRTLGELLLPRVGQLVLMFIAVTALTLVLSAVASAVR
jgi:hypothetical protein